MLDKIQNNTSEAVNQSQNLDRISQIGVSNPFRENEGNFFIDECDISNDAYQKYQREVDVKHFSEIFNGTDQKASDDFVLRSAFDGLLSIDDDVFIEELLNNDEFLNDVISGDF